MSRTTNILMLITGVAAGAALGMLFAPKAGKDTRADLMKKGEDLYDRLSTVVKKGKGMVDEATEKARDVADKARSAAGDMADKARQAASDTHQRAQSKV